MAPPRQPRPAPENPPAPPVLESLPSDAPVHEPLSPDAPVLEPLASEAPPPQPPMMPAFFMGPDGRTYPGGPMYPGAYAPPPQAIGPPPEDTIFQGTVTNFGRFNKDGRATRHCYGFIKIDHSGNEVFVSEEDAPDGYLSQGDRCEFRIVDARTKNRRTGAPQWKAADVVCIQRVLPPRALAPDQIKQIESSILEQVEANGGEMRVQDMRAQYQQRGPQSLIKRIKDKQLLLRFAANTPGLTYDASDGSVRRTSTAAPEPPGELSEVARQLKAREQALREREEALAKREAARDLGAESPERAGGVPETLRRLGLEHVAPLLEKEQIDDATLPLLSLEDLVEAGLRPRDARRIVDATALAGRLADVSVGAPAHAKTLAAQDELDAAAVHQARLESSLSDHRAELLRLRSVLSQREIPDALTCPITLEIMKDPCMACDGFTYERSAIESWLTKKSTSPKTGEPLSTTVLFPNHGAKQLIAEFLDETRRLQAAIDASGDEDDEDVERASRRFFVGALPKASVRDADLRAYFERFGAVSEAVVIGSRACAIGPGKEENAGFGFVTFVEESAARACAATRHHDLHGTFIDVKEYERREARIEQYAPAPPAPAQPTAPPNCALDAIIAVLSQSPTFRRELGDGAQAAAGQSNALRYLGAAFRASAEGSDAGVDAAVDGLRAALVARLAGVSELATGGARPDLAKVLGEVVSVLGSAKRCRAAATALRTRGLFRHQACVVCDHRNEDMHWDELARSAPAAALIYAARSGFGHVADVFRDDAHAHAAKSCDACHAPAACEVDVVLEHAAKVLVLSLEWSSTDHNGDDVAALLELVWRETPFPVKRVFSSLGKIKFELGLFAVAVFQNARYTAFVRAQDGSDSWTHHDRRSAVAVGTFANVVQRCRDGAMLPYLLFYDIGRPPPWRRGLAAEDETKGPS